MKNSELNLSLYYQLVRGLNKFSIEKGTHININQLNDLSEYPRFTFANDHLPPCVHRGVCGRCKFQIISYKDMLSCKFLVLVDLAWISPWWSLDTKDISMKIQKFILHTSLEDTVTIHGGSREAIERRKILKQWKHWFTVLRSFCQDNVS